MKDICVECGAIISFEDEEGCLVSCPSCGSLLMIENHKLVQAPELAWSQRLCQRCKRFLSKRQFKYCKRCASIVLNEQRKAWKGNEKRT